tara:strand:- start:40999 stop:42297 length:1299 start_codon:yes stop_codon:yes gene_type:complete
MGPIYNWDDFTDMLRRRAVVLVLVVLMGCVASVYWALSHPHLYSSSEVIQIEQPKIANDLAPSTVEGSSARRLQLIEQQLMARASLTEMIEKYDLYDNLTALRLSEKVDLLRRSVTITGVAAPREGFGDDGTISVLTFTAEMDNAQDAQSVAHEFAERTRALSAAQRQDQTRETLEFFQRQEDNLTRDIAALEAELAAFRSANDLSIAGSLEFRRGEISSLNDAILELDREIIAARLARDRIAPDARAATVAREQAEIDATLNSLTTQRSLLNAQRTELTASLQTTPEVERELAKFDRRMTQLQGQLDVISTRRNEAEVGFSLESAERGEKLITIESAPLPDFPVTMSRKKRAMMGAVASGGLALLIAFLLELRRPVIRSARQMQRETGLMPVVSIPDMPNRRRSLRQIQQARRTAGQRGRAARLARNAQKG